MSGSRQIIRERGVNMRSILPWRRKERQAAGMRAAVPLAEYLQKVDLFKNLHADEVDALFHGVMLRECKPGTLFFTPDDSTEHLFILKEGNVALYRLTASGKRLVTRRIGPGTVFGEMGLLGQTMQGCFAEAVEPSLVCVATREDILGLLNHSPDIALRLLEGVGTRLKTLEERLEQAVFSPVNVRLAGFLLANVDPSTGIVAGFTHAEIADTIGTLRQTVTETLSEMAGQGLVEVSHKQIKVANHGGLADIVAREESASR